MRLILVMVGIAVSIQLHAQQKKNMRLVKGVPTICYLSTKNEFTTIAAPLRNSTARTKSANIVVTYDGFTTQAQAAFQEAVDIWEGLLDTDMTIRIEAHWAPLGPGVLGSAGPSTYIADFDGAPKQNVLYPIALAEKIANKDLNSTSEPDIVATFNSTNNSWHYGLTGNNPPDDTYDLVSIVLHEIGHGLGITHGYTIDGTVGGIPDYFSGRATTYETSIVTSTGQNLVNDFTQPSTQLKSVMTSALFYSSPLVRSVNSNNNATLYTPANYSAGSSIAHLDEDVYPPGDNNSLMTPFIGAAERILDPGPIIKNILKDMGWIATVIEHAPLANTESTTGPFNIIAKIRNTNGYSAGSVKLSYKTTGSFTDVVMTATGNANEFKASLPTGSSAYSYFISVTDNDSRVFTNPGTIITPGSAPVQGLFNFESGPDTQAPVITHSPKEFITNTDPLAFQATVTDNIGVDNVKIQYKVNGVDKADVAMTKVANTKSTYQVSIDFGGTLQVDDKVEYRIRAEDKAVAHNVAFSPSSTTFYEVNVVGLGATKTNYANNFDDLSADDFFGNGFTVAKPSGFDNGAIHSDHPYPVGGAEGTEVNLIYNLKSPIKISSKPEHAILKFDEIVLVEPGEDGAVWPSADFYDYVVVEGSTDGGTTWISLEDGYDARYNATWLARWNATNSTGNSTATGTPSMYRTHIFNLLNKFTSGDEVAFRFRLYSDPFSYGWGWSIDNLKIQIDDTPPVILHQHADFVTTDSTLLNLNVKITDDTGVEQIFFDYRINGGETVTTEIAVVVGQDQYTQPIKPAELDLGDGDNLEYAFRAIDSVGNSGSFPSTGFIKTAIISMSTSADGFASDFSSESSIIGGNFFGVSKANLTDNAFTTAHPYLAGMGTDSVSDYSWIVKTPIKISSTNPFIYYKDIALVEYSGGDVKDYVVVEGSKDGVNWSQLIAPYAANSVPLWKSIYDVAANGSQTLFRTHTIDMTSKGVFKADDVILIRFRLHSDATKVGWGWAVDDLSIQGTVTGVEPAYTLAGFDTWPNPVTDGSLHLKMSLPAASQVNVEILTMQGQVLSNDRFSAPSGDFQRDYQADWGEGFYVVRIQSDFGTAVKKIIKLNSKN